MEDVVIRRTCQTLLMVFSLLCSIVCAAFDMAVIEEYIGRINTQDHWYVYTYVQFLGRPYQSDLGPFLAAIGGVFPVVVNAVCFEVDRTQTPPVPLDVLNSVGHAFFLLLVVGIILCTISVVLTLTFSGPVTNLALNTANVTGIKSLLNGLLSFEAIYIVQIVGLKPK